MPIRPVRRPRRIKANFEQANETRGDVRVGGECHFHIALAEGAAGLPQHLGIKPQEADLPGGKPGEEDEAIKAVIFDPAGP